MEVRRATEVELASMLAAGETPPLFPLALHMEGCATQEEMNKNFYATLDRGYAPLNSHIGGYQGVVSLVGSGPSINETYKDLRGDVIAINGAISFLLGKGIVPKWAMLWDAADIVEKFAAPHPGITYLVASRCHPKVFERLKDCNVVVWHASGDQNIMELMNLPEVIAKQPCHEPLINGGTAGVTRGILLATTLGYKNIHIFGGDSSYAADGSTHVSGGSLVKEKDVTIAMGNEPPTYFRTTPEWCAQVEEYRAIYAILTCASGVTLDVHGGGMLGCMHERLEEEKKLMGVEKFLQLKAQQEVNRANLGAAATEEMNKINPLQEKQNGNARV